MASLKELKELKKEAVQVYEIACNVELVRFVKLVTDVYLYRVQVSGISEYSAYGLITHDDASISASDILTKVLGFLGDQELELVPHIYISHDSLVKWHLDF